MIASGSRSSGIQPRGISVTQSIASHSPDSTNNRHHAHNHDLLTSQKRSRSVRTDYSTGLIPLQAPSTPSPHPQKTVTHLHLIHPQLHLIPSLFTHPTHPLRLHRSIFTSVPNTTCPKDRSSKPRSPTRQSKTRTLGRTPPLVVRDSRLNTTHLPSRPIHLYELQGLGGSTHQPTAA